MVKGMKKIMGAFMMALFGIGCISCALCFFLVLFGKLPIPTIGEYLFSLVAYLVSLCFMVLLTCVGWCFWRDKPVHIWIRELLDRKSQTHTAMLEESEFAKLDAFEQKKLNCFLVKDKVPFAAYPIEMLYCNEMKNGTGIGSFFLVLEDVTAVNAIRQYQEYLEWRKQYKNQANTIPKHVHIRVSSEKALAGCDDFYYKQCLKAGIHIVIHTGPYTFRDITADKECTVTVQTEDRKGSPGEITGTWSYK